MLIKETMKFPAVLLIVLIACSSTQKSPNPIPAPDSDLCGAMCNHLVQLGCEEGQPLYDSDLPGPRGIPNQSCEGFCQKQQKNGIFINPRCVMWASSCTAVEEMRQGKDCP